MAVDYLGREMGVGDEVVFMQKNYRNFWKGVIIKITPQTVLISHESTNTCGTETKQGHDQVIKVIK